MEKKGRVSMDRHAQIIELHRRGYSNRRIAQTLKMCKKSVQRYINRPLIPEPKKVPVSPDPLQKLEIELLDSAVEKFPAWLQELDWKHLLLERAKGVPLSVLYKEIECKKVSYWSFWSTLKRLALVVYPDTPKTTMRLNHKPGEKAFVDYGDGIGVVDRATGEIRKTWIFVGTLPFSSRVFAEFVFDQKLASFISSHEKMWKAFGGVTLYTVSDNLKSAVLKPHLYDPDVNRIFLAYCNQAGFAVLPARPRKPRDKANVETHVGVLQNSFFQEVRNRIFFSISELNIALTAFLEQFNNQVMKDYGISRNQRFEPEKALLQPLPAEDFEIPETRDAVVHPDCHIQFGKAFYSVPWQYVGKTVRVVATAKRVQIFDTLSLERIAIHSPATKPGSRQTDDLHWPPEKKEHCNFTLERAKRDAEKIGPRTLEMVSFLSELPHPLQYLRRIQGWLRNVSCSKFSREAMEYAATMALQHGQFRSSYITDCAAFFEAGGTRRPSGTGAPARHPKHLHLQK